jgi:hypothetical protein
MVMAPSSFRLACLAWTSLLLAGCPAPEALNETDSQSGTTGPKTTGPETTTGDCPIGMLGCPCTGGGACDPGLTCNLEQLCEPEAGSSTDAQTTAVSSTTSGTEDTTDTTSSGSSTGDPSECTPTGDEKESEECRTLDPARPFCGGDGVCIGCGAAGKNACDTATEGMRPICLPGGACVECDSASAHLNGQCGEASPHCNLDTFTCEGCFEHKECPQTACEVKARKCFPPEKIIYVRRGPTPANPCTGNLGGGGTMAMPYCDIETAISSVIKGGYSSGYTFYVMPSDDTADHGPVFIPGGADVPVSYAFVHAPGGPFDPHTRFFGDGPMITVPGNVSLYVVNFSIILSNDAFLDSAVGVDCQAQGSVWLDDTRVLYARGVGVRGTDCQVHLRRSSVAFGYSEGADIKGGSLNMTNSFITENTYTNKYGGGAVRLRTGATGAPKVDIVYSTLVNNANEPLKNLGDTINCEGPATVNVRNSVLGRKPGTGNAGVVCPDGVVSVSRSIVDGDFDEGGNTKLAAEDISTKYLKSVPLTGAYKIVEAYAQVFAMVAQWQLGDVHFDYDLEPRNASPGGPDYAGADVFHVP